MTNLVIGATGMLGAPVARQLQDDGYDPLLTIFLAVPATLAALIAGWVRSSPG